LFSNSDLWLSGRRVSRWGEGEGSDGGDASGSESVRRGLLVVGGCGSGLEAGVGDELGWDGGRWEWRGTGWSEGSKSSRERSGPFSNLDEFGCFHRSREGG